MRGAPENFAKARILRHSESMEGSPQSPDQASNSILGFTPNRHPVRSKSSDTDQESKFESRSKEWKVVLYFSASGTRHQNKRLRLRPTPRLRRLFVSPPSHNSLSFESFYCQESMKAWISLETIAGWSHMTRCPDEGTLFRRLTPGIRDS